MLDHGGWGRADLTVLPARPSLTDVIEFCWIDTWSRRRRPPMRFRIVADDAPHLIWHVHGGRHQSQSLAVVGARSTFHDIDVSTRLVTVGVRLRPGVLPSLTGRSARHLTDCTLGIDRRLANGRPASPERVVEALTNYIGEHTARSETHQLARRVRSLDPHACHSVCDVARDLGINERSLRNLSHDHLGMGLKRFIENSPSPRGPRARALGRRRQLESNRERRRICGSGTPHPRLPRTARRNAGRVSPSRDRLGTRFRFVQSSASHAT